VSVNAIAKAILDAPRFAVIRQELAVCSLVRDLPAIERTVTPIAVDWNYALGCASVLVSAETERAQDAALRVAQGCLASSKTLQNQRDAAAVLLERMGNRPALRLAHEREMIAEEAWRDVPAPLRLDVVRRRLELSIPVASGETLEGNGFQREFWTALTDADWVSVSAPTSAGKSYLVKRWFEERAASIDTFHGVYVVPTRALIEEVAGELQTHFGEEIGIYTIPWDAAIGTRPKEIHVMTQERLHLLHERFSNFKADLVFLDEAQKFADGERGILLQRVLEDSVRRNPKIQVIFASPQSQNPEMLLEGSPPGTIASALAGEAITVNQNLVWADQVRGKPRRWDAQLVTGSLSVLAGSFEIQARPDPTSQRLPLVAVALGRDGGNVIYVNGAADAEKAALQIHDALGDTADISGESRVAALRELVQKTVHPSYSLEKVLTRGVAFHYGNMPLIVRTEIEHLFREEVLCYLVCTSTLLEGVNLPCRNLFARGPKKGNNKVMSPHDFWNLAGRAGRWGKEFEGNIVCVDATDRKLWPEPPTRRSRHPLTRATDTALNDIPAVRSYVAEGAPAERARSHPLLEPVYSFLAARVSAGESLGAVPGVPGADSDAMAALQAEITAVLEGITVPAEIYRHHAGISPPAMQRLLNHLAEPARQDRLLLAPPEDKEAAVSYVKALARCSTQLGANFGPVKRQWMLAVLITSWMRGYPLPRLIEERISYLKLSGDVKLPKVIRETMQDVEQEARFRAPKYLACYSDLLQLHLKRVGRESEAAEMPDVSMMLELGVSRDTHVSLMALGLSRTSAVALGEYIVEDELTREQCVQWLHEQDLAQLDLPILVRQEIVRAQAIAANR
jgi:hypothetical protein